MLAIQHFLFLSAALFSIGLAIVIIKKNIITILIGLELMLNAANINLVAFSRYDPQLIQGQMFVIVVAAAETAVALAIAFKVYQHFRTPELNKISEVGE